MVIGLLTIAGIPTTIGVAQAVSAQKKQNAAAKEKAKFHLTAELAVDGERCECSVVLTEGKVCLALRNENVSHSRSCTSTTRKRRRPATSSLGTTSPTPARKATGGW
jgi:hypothetical protein